MKKKIFIILFAVVLALGLVLSFSPVTLGPMATPALAATITTAGSGNWNSTTPNAPWPGGTVPAAGDSVIIRASVEVQRAAIAILSMLKNIAKSMTEESAGWECIR